MRKYFKNAGLKFSLLALVGLASSSLSAREITYFKQEFTSVAHMLIGDSGYNSLYLMPMNNIDQYLSRKFPLQRTSLQAINRRHMPGKSLVRAACHAIYHHGGQALQNDAKNIFGWLNEGTPHTFAITKDKLVFVESASKEYSNKAKDIFTKHYVISGMKNNVRYAGEFFVHTNPKNGDVHVVFDNASGTYRPNGSILRHVKSLLEENFGGPGLHFHVKEYNQRINTLRLFADENADANKALMLVR